MTRIRRLLRHVAPLCLLAAPATAASLTVTVTNIHNASGHVRIGVCEKSQFLGERCAYHAVVPSHAGSVTTVISGVRPGLYAVAAYQDETDLGHLRRSLLGIPEEGSGFSRNPALGMGPPSFAQCAVSIGAEDAAVAVMLRYF